MEKTKNVGSMKAAVLSEYNVVEWKDVPNLKNCLKSWPDDEMLIYGWCQIKVKDETLCLVYGRLHLSSLDIKNLLYPLSRSFGLVKVFG